MPYLFLAGLLAATPAEANPIETYGTFCDPFTCEDVTATLQPGGVGTLLYRGMTFQLEWRRAENNFDFKVDYSVFRGTISRGCASASDYFTVGAPNTLYDYDWFLCVVP